MATLVSLCDLILCVSVGVTKHLLRIQFVIINVLNVQEWSQMPCLCVPNVVFSINFEHWHARLLVDDRLLRKHTVSQMSNILLKTTRRRRPVENDTPAVKWQHAGNLKVFAVDFSTASTTVSLRTMRARLQQVFTQ